MELPVPCVSKFDGLGHQGDPLFYFCGGVGHMGRSPCAFRCNPCLHGGSKCKLCEVGVALALFIGATYDYNSVISNSTPCPFLGDVSGSFTTS